MMQAIFLEEAIRQRQGFVLNGGAFAVRTGPHTGRSAQSRFVVKDKNTETVVDWGEVNKPWPEAEAEAFFTKLMDHLSRQSLYGLSRFIGPYPVEVKTCSAWHAAFADNMLRKSYIGSLLNAVGSEAARKETIEIWHDPLSPASHYGIKSSQGAFILLDPSRRRIGIVGTNYGGEIKKSAFSMANYLLPPTGVLPMHASANCRADGSDSCVIFGLSGTGKTTLSAQPGRYLIGDDEISWSHSGLSNLEGGCYAKLAHLAEQSEPEIFRAVSKFGSIQENVIFDEATRETDFENLSITENTRGSYKLTSMDRVFAQDREAMEPKTIVFLTADAFGALPAVAKLDDWQMRYHFMSGFTAKVAGTEVGVTEPKAVFSACFGAPFMPRPPADYARLLAERVAHSGASVWLLNTGWRGGYQSGQRFPLAVTRKILQMIQDGSLLEESFEQHPVFGFEVPRRVRGLDAEFFAIPEGPQVTQLAQQFVTNHEKFHGSGSSEIVKKGGPSLYESRTMGGSSSSQLQGGARAAREVAT